MSKEICYKTEQDEKEESIIPKAEEQMELNRMRQSEYRMQMI